MPLYDFHCRECAEIFEVYLNIHDCDKAICPHCKEITEEKLITTTPHIFDRSVKTVGVYAEQNTKRLGDKAKDYEAQDKRITREKLEQQQKRPFWRDTDKPLDLKKINNIDNYILTGQKG